MLSYISKNVDGGIKKIILGFQWEMGIPSRKDQSRNWRRKWFSRASQHDQSEKNKVSWHANLGL